MSSRSSPRSPIASTTSSAFDGQRRYNVAFLVHDEDIADVIPLPVFDVRKEAERWHW
jgi:hypothetical protein